MFEEPGGSMDRLSSKAEVERSMVLMSHRAIGEWVLYPTLSLQVRPPSHGPSMEGARIKSEIPVRKEKTLHKRNC